MGAAKFPAVGKFDNLAGFEPVSWQRLPTRSGIDGKAHSRATTANDPEQVERHLNATQSIVAKIFQRGIHVASLSTDSAGRRRIQFVDTNGKRRAVRLGKVSMREASEIKTKIEAIVEAQTAMISLDRETAKWLNKIGNVLYGKLVAVDLASPRESVDRVKLLEFINGYIDARVDIKPGTVEQLEVARKHLVDFFGGAKPIARITNGDADEFRQHLFSIMGSENTARRLCGRAKQLFRYAARKRLIEESPFADMKGNGVKSNMDRAVFVTRETIAKVLDVCPDIQWRLLVALARYGGLRCPSEPLALRWGDVDWERGRLRVSSPKTEHHEGKAFRWIPIFPELRPVMDDAYALAPDDGTEHIITRYRDPRVNLRTQFERIVRKAGQHARNGAGRDVPHSRGVRLDREQRSRRAESLPASHR